MPSSRKKQIVQASQKRQRRGITYLAVVIIIITVIAVGVYVYATSQGSSSPSSTEYAKLNTSEGLIEIELYRSLTPHTVDNFVSLANSGFYNNLVWHRIVQGFVIQTGDPNSRNGLNNSTWGQGGSTQSVPFEYASSLHNSVGYVGMASTAAGTGGTSQFYINLVDNSATLDGKYAVFGKVINGMSAVNNIGSLQVYPSDQPVNPSAATLISVTISNTP